MSHQIIITGTIFLTVDWWSFHGHDIKSTGNESSLAELNQNEELLCIKGLSMKKKATQGMGENISKLCK